MVRFESPNLAPVISIELFRTSGESEYWFAMVKVILIVFFIIVGLIFDWGGVKGHPGPVCAYSYIMKNNNPMSTYRITGPLELPKRTGLPRWFCGLRSDLRLRVLLLRWYRTRGRRCWGIREALQIRASSDQSHFLPHYLILYTYHLDDWLVHQSRRRNLVNSGV